MREVGEEVSRFNRAGPVQDSAVLPPSRRGCSQFESHSSLGAGLLQAPPQVKPSDRGRPQLLTAALRFVG